MNFVGRLSSDFFLIDFNLIHSLITASIFLWKQISFDFLINNAKSRGVLRTSNKGLGVQFIFRKFLYL